MPSATNNDRSATRTSASRRPSTSQRRSLPSSMASTMARSRWECSTNTAVTSAGSSILDSVRSTRSSGTVRDRFEPPRRLVDSPRGTGLVRTGVPPRGDQVRVEARHRRNRRAIVRADRLDSRSTMAHHPPIAALMGEDLERTGRLYRRPGPCPPQGRTSSGRTRPSATCWATPDPPRTPDTDPATDGRARSGSHPTARQHQQHSELLSIGEAARLAGVAPRYLRRLAQRHEASHPAIEAALAQGREPRPAYLVAHCGGRWTAVGAPR